MKFIYLLFLSVVWPVQADNLLSEKEINGAETLGPVDLWS
jgi:hypothetical protein